jgi:ribonuclease-3
VSGERTVDRIEAVLGLSFNDRGLLQQALVHGSYLNEQGGSPLDSYERLEFLGDAVLELVVSTEIYHRLPQLSEGELSKIRAGLVCRESLSQAAQSLGLGRFISMGKGEEASGGRDRESILEAVFEALVAAIYLDQGFQSARGFILKRLEPGLETVFQRGFPPQNPKSALQEHFQGQGKPAPHYQLVSAKGPDHCPEFTVEVLIGAEVIGSGRGGKKADAERAAALDALTKAATHQEFQNPQ